TAKEGGVCIVLNQSCCTYVDESKRVVSKLWEYSKTLHEVALGDTSFGFADIWHKLTSWLLNFGWLKQLFVLMIAVISLGVFVCVTLKCSRCCDKGTLDRYVNWKKHQLPQETESGKYFGTW
ncbi:ERVV2 protein, partial [Semnornis frantzii]|nr:ERVV2 protein [Semnornis frantzii]